MDCIFHFGLHKTASTFIQRLAFANRDRLLHSAGVFYGTSGAEGHHAEVWPLLDGSAEPILGLVGEAERRHARLALFSCEDLESLLFRYDVAEALFSRLRDRVDKITVFLYVRNQADYFWSIRSELSKRTYLDVFQTYYEVMTKGYFLVDSPSRRHTNSPYWYFCFDYLKHVRNFAAFLRGICKNAAVVVCDFDAPRRYPGDVLFERIGARDIFPSDPAGFSKVNIRLSETNETANFLVRFGESADAPTMQALGPEVQRRLAPDPAEKTAISRSLIRKFAPGTAVLLKELGASPRETTPPGPPSD